MSSSDVVATTSGRRRRCRSLSPPPDIHTPKRVATTPPLLERMLVIVSYEELGEFRVCCIDRAEAIAFDPSFAQLFDRIYHRVTHTGKQKSDASAQQIDDANAVAQLMWSSRQVHKTLRKNVQARYLRVFSEYVTEHFVGCINFDEPMLEAKIENDAIPPTDWIVRFDTFY